MTRQYCQSHKEMEDYPACETSTGVRSFYNAQLPPKERPILWTKTDASGKTEIRYPGRNDGEMPSYYRTQGYERTEFNSYHEHQKFCKENELVNHAVEGIK